MSTLHSRTLVSETKCRKTLERSFTRHRKCYSVEKKRRKAKKSGKRTERISSRTVRRQLYKRADDRFSYKTPNTSCSEVNLERVLDMQMGYLDGMHSAIAQSLCSEDEFYFADECPIFIGVLPRKGRCRKDEQLYGRAPYRPRKFTLHSAIGPRGYYKVWLSENNANDAENEVGSLPSSYEYHKLESDAAVKAFKVNMDKLAEEQGKRRADLYFATENQTNPSEILKKAYENVIALKKFEGTLEDYETIQAEAASVAFKEKVQQEGKQKAEVMVYTTWSELELESQESSAFKVVKEARKNMAERYPRSTGNKAEPYVSNDS
ncbi:hypothetical protein OS493_020121 [Desmophyllum pertusum]|uniref:Uncharacterized protein n=1 Tax=Desmophyllum pertusum TaxID=174260 RepID=A0A9X0A0F8_9CNID|nr:hypothetical protein OS493_020121 [Desmophyllum pertusum]